MKEYFIKYNDYNICVYESGTGSVPVVLLHGGGLDSAMLSWREVMNLFSDKYIVYAIDLLGYGKSDKPEGMSGELFYQKHISAVESVVEQLHLSKFALSGLSFGGAVSIGYALKNPDKVTALIPVDSWGLVSKMPMHRLYYWYVNTSLLKTSYCWLSKYRWMVKWSLSYSLIGDKTKISETLVEEIFALCKAQNAELPMQDYQRSSITKQSAIPDYTQQLRNLEMPVLFINGEKDSLVLVKDVTRAAQNVSNGKIHIMKGCKHWPQKERPDEYAQTVQTFLSGLNAEEMQNTMSMGFFDGE